MSAFLLIWLIISLCSVFAKVPLLWRMRGDLQVVSMRYLFAQVAGGLLFDAAVVFIAIRVLLNASPDAPPSLNIIILTVVHLAMTVPAILFAGYMLGVFAGGSKDETPAQHDRL